MKIYNTLISRSKNCNHLFYYTNTWLHINSKILASNVGRTLAHTLVLQGLDNKNNCKKWLNSLIGTERIFSENTMIYTRLSVNRRQLANSILNLQLNLS